MPTIITITGTRITLGPGRWADQRFCSRPRAGI